MRLTQRLKAAQDLSWWDMRHLPGMQGMPGVQNMIGDMQQLQTPPDVRQLLSRDPEVLATLRRNMAAGQRALSTHDYMAQFNPGADPDQAKLRPGLLASNERAGQFNQLPAGVRHYLANQAADPMYRKALARHMSIMDQQRAADTGKPQQIVRSRYRAPKGSKVTPLTNRVHSTPAGNRSNDATGGRSTLDIAN